MKADANPTPSPAGWQKNREDREKLRQWLSDNNATHVYTTLPLGTMTITAWKVGDEKLLVENYPDGEWHVYVPFSHNPNADEVLRSLSEYLAQ